MSRPTLTGERVVLTPMSWDHLEDLCALDADPEVMRFLGPPRSRADVMALMPGRLSPSDDALDLGFWVGHETDRFLGWWCLSLEGPDLAEIGWRLHPHTWGRGLATEGALLLIDHGFATVGLHRIIAETMAVNLPSRGVMRKVGMTHARTDQRTWDHPLPGSEQGEVVYELDRETWASR
ncbi:MULTISPECIES: GNAT family N-acetyltransferase [Phycicoccus]|jgi:RimJ/RimL family protein N-acetyltransferase|uniref:GNAT family N-acetyltransferase n=1 Tax=Phycicoccus TaxID=367298 RepID=UPI002CC3358C|nr:GNAT family N-acetyltransferase [Phycicoccus elongatus]